MGIAIGIVLVAATVISFVLINARVGRMARQYNDQWTVDPHTGQPVPPEQQGPGHGAQHHGAQNHGGGGSGHHSAQNHGGPSMAAVTTADSPMAAEVAAAITASSDSAGHAAQAAGDEWAPLADRFLHGHYGTIRGRVRTHVIDAHLRAHLPLPPAALIDVGGGGGNQSIPLARSGYHVTIVDPSAAMLAGAADALAKEQPDVAARISLVQAGAEDARTALGGRRFAGVLCHGVIMYVDDPRPFTAALADLAEPGAIISIVAKNARCLATRPALEGRWQEALAAFGSERQINGLGVDTRADTVEDLSALLSAAGVEPVAWYGVRLFTDGWASAYDEADQSGASAGNRDALLAVELEASRRDPYRQLSRLFHLVGVRRRSTNTS